jgi:hypothetical protein
MVAAAAVPEESQVPSTLLRQRLDAKGASRSLRLETDVIPEFQGRIVKINSTEVQISAWTCALSLKDEPLTGHVGLRIFLRMAPRDFQSIHRTKCHLLLGTRLQIADPTSAQRAGSEIEVDPLSGKYTFWKY